MKKTLIIISTLILFNCDGMIAPPQEHTINVEYINTLIEKENEQISELLDILTTKDIDNRRKIFIHSLIDGHVKQVYDYEKLIKNNNK